MLRKGVKALAARGSEKACRGRGREPAAGGRSASEPHLCNDTPLGSSRFSMLLTPVQGHAFLESSGLIRAHHSRTPGTSLRSNKLLPVKDTHRLQPRPKCHPVVLEVLNAPGIGQHLAPPHKGSAEKPCFLSTSTPCTRTQIK